MKVVIAGGGDIGRALATYLKGLGYHVVVIERDEAACRELEARGVEVVKGDVTDPHVMEQVRVEEADTFLALTGSDDVNLVSALLAKHQGARRVLVRVENPVYVEACRMVGLTEICSPAEATAFRIDASVHGFKLADVVSIGEHFVDVEHVEIGEGSELAWRKIKELGEEVLKNSYPAFVLSEGEVKFPDPDLTLEPGDVLVLIRHKEGASGCLS
ncbi:MAG: hypothetical protein DRJ98_02390 [Thermoprotei archaeon]|nr:MAG: hypothetical protein DRJ98_02390 [Thermoprotei archaeon]RLF18274.1 MAG: hypothetical protein DRN06_01925 [Thermoprotei archaeon]